MIIFCLKPNGKAKQVIKGDCERKKQNMASNEGHEWGGSNLKHLSLMEPCMRHPALALALACMQLEPLLIKLSSICLATCSTSLLAISLLL